MNRVIAAVAAVLMMMLAAPAGAVTISPTPDGTHFDASDAVGPGDGHDDARVNTVDISDSSGRVTGCLLLPTSCDLDALTIGRSYNAVVVDSGHGYWDCGVDDQDIDCSWTYPFRSMKEYVFTYSGTPRQALTRYFAPATVKIARAKAHRAHRWAVTCTATRSGEAAAGARIGIEWRTKTQPRWHALRKMNWMPKVYRANSGGRVHAVIPWERARRGSVRCVSHADWHTKSAVSRPVKVHRR
jgi:hypothetical protein